MKTKKNKYLDQEEKDLVESLENNEWHSTLTKAQKKKYTEYAKYSLHKNKRINIRMTERDYKKIQIKAIQEGLPYQGLISMLIHKYNEGKVKFIY